MKNHIYKNNIAVSSANSPRDPFSVSSKLLGVSEISNNLWYKEGSGDVEPLFNDTAHLDFRLKDGSPGIDKGSSDSTSSLDIGFDFKCIKKMDKPGTSPYPGVIKAYPWVAHEPDFAYIKSLGGIKYCFKPKARPQGNGADIGAYER